MPSTRRTLLATLGTAALGGCLSISTYDSGNLGSIEGEWPVVGQDAGHRRRVDAGPAEPELAWVTTLPEARSAGSPSIAGDRLYAAADAISETARHRHRVHALDASTGAVRWQVPLRIDPNRAPTLVGNRIIVSGRRDLERGRVVAFTERYGEEHWLYDIDARVTAPPVAEDGIVFVPDWSGAVHALATFDGTVEWAGPVDPDGADRTFARPVAIADGTLFLGSLSGRTGVLAVEATSGESLWTGSTGAVTGGPVADGELVIVQSHSVFTAFDHDGRERWTYNIPQGVSSSALALDHRHVYVARDGTLHAITRDGQPGWTYEGLASDTPEPTVAGGTVLVSGGGELLALDRDDGEVRWRVEVDGSGGAITTPEAIFMRASEGRVLGLGEA